MLAIYNIPKKLNNAGDSKLQKNKSLILNLIFLLQFLGIRHCESNFCKKISEVIYSAEEDRFVVPSRNDA